MAADNVRLLKLRVDTKAWMDGFKARGGKVTTWSCGHCGNTQETPKPSRRELGEARSYTDSMTTCLNCGELSFVLVYPSGKTVARSGIG